MSGPAAVTAAADQDAPSQEPHEPEEGKLYDGDDEPAYDEAHAVSVEVLQAYELLEELNAPKPFSGSVIGRADWGARPPRSRTALRNPRGSTAHWEGPRLGTFAHASCAAKVRGIQAYHMDHNKWDDIAYTSVVCPHGAIFEGRWWGIRTAANGTNAGNGASYAHCVLIGQGDPFPEEARQGLRTVFRLAREQGGAGDERWCHSDWKATACPGPEILQFVRSM